MNNIYERLRERLETMASGYPETQNGVELKILQKLFPRRMRRCFLK